MDGYPIRVAVIGPADLTADVVDAGRGFSGLEVWALPYERVDQAAELYAKACGGGGAEMAPADAALFTGPIGYRRGTRGEPVAAVPTAYVPYSPLWLYAPLFAVADRGPLRRVSLDSLDRGVLEATYRELELPLEAVEVYEPPADDPSADEVAAFHRRAMEEGRSTHALTCVLSVYRRLRAAGVQCSWLVPSRVALEEALEKLLYVVEGVRARGAQIVVGLVRLRGNGNGNGGGHAPDDGSPFKAARLRLKAHELLLSQVEEFDGHLVDSGSGDFQFFTTRAQFEKTTGLYSHWPLVEKLVRAGLEMSAGVGLGATAGEAGVNARAALDEALRGGGSACFVILEGKRLIGPLGPGALAYRVRNTDRVLLEMAGELGTAVASLQRALSALGGMTGEFTARDLALRLRVGLRTAHRVVRKLREAGYVVEVGQESAGTRGRPRRVFRQWRGAPASAAESAAETNDKGGGHA
ncbi:MAG: hypothetical protein ACYC9Q_01995 [Bacillota bacterium]